MRSQASPRLSRVQRLEHGKGLRKRIPRSSHAEANLSRRGRDPLAILEQSDVGRILALLPIRYGRMLQSPFAFLRASAAVMAFDLARTPVTGINVQACGDAHLMNFGAFATPDGRRVFDLNDFDETLPAPWEWDVKRLAASIWVAGRYCSFAERKCAAGVEEALRSYRERLAEYASRSTLHIWYARIDGEPIIKLAGHTKAGRLLGASASHDAVHASAHLLPKLTELARGKRRIKDQPPLVYHPKRAALFRRDIDHALSVYRKTLPPERRALLDRYSFVDAAMKVVGVGSVGTVCAAALLLAENDEALFLQVKQARASVLEPYASRNVFRNNGERVVIGQRLMQSASDLFLGWSHLDKPSIDFYVRQLRDIKVSVALDKLSSDDFIDYARYCGWALGRAHAKGGDAAAISGYLGGADAFDRAVGRYARAYADQTEKDYAELVKAVQSGRIRTESDAGG